MTQTPNPTPDPTLGTSAVADTEAAPEEKKKPEDPPPIDNKEKKKIVIEGDNWAAILNSMMDAALNGTFNLFVDDYNNFIKGPLKGSEHGTPFEQYVNSKSLVSKALKELDRLTDKNPTLQELKKDIRQAMTPATKEEANAQQEMYHAAMDGFKNKAEMDVKAAEEKWTERNFHPENVPEQEKGSYLAHINKIKKPYMDDIKNQAEEARKTAEANWITKHGPMGNKMKDAIENNAGRKRELDAPRETEANKTPNNLGDPKQAPAVNMTPPASTSPAGFATEVIQKAAEAVEVRNLGTPTTPLSHNPTQNPHPPPNELNP
ncbi:MAG TPA: hypothetical protein DDY37_02710 [Legionella sp.]|nr:hypothetical protein [Legionella sp.]